MKPPAFAPSLANTLVLGLIYSPVVLAHGSEHAENGGHQDMHEMPDASQDDTVYPPTYFSHPDHAAIIYSHIALMIVAWVLVLPVAVVMSLARSRLTLAMQLLFFGTNTAGIALAAVYNSKTPDLYPGNAHHSIGWVFTWVALAQLSLNLLQTVAGVVNDALPGSLTEKRAFIPLFSKRSSQAGRRYSPREYRLSNDSGQGSEPNTESLRSSSVSTPEGGSNERLYDDSDRWQDDGGRFSSFQGEDEYDDVDLSPSKSARARDIITSVISTLVSSRIWHPFQLLYKIIDRIILPAGFIAITTGVVTFGRLFEAGAIFNGLAHWIKGGVFFWLGLFTLGRWCGSFGDLGWAWNVRPGNTQKWRPSAEFVESALILFYGITNIFLEHLGGWGGDWTAQDLEHMSITVLFIGGGLCGVLIESSMVRDLLNTTISDTAQEQPVSSEDQFDVSLLPPATYRFSLNPFPALVILLLGIMMSSHQQSSMTSSMVHKQWGNLLLGASLARCMTYLLVYLRPPRSILPSRPPTELLAAFGLIAGGIIFMASSTDTVTGMIHYGLDPMFMYTVTMGSVGLLMAWEIFVLAIKGWAVRRERRAEQTQNHIA